jgi:hypothetical protein
MPHRKKKAVKARQVVWRVSADAPLGEYVVAGSRPVKEVSPLGERPDSGWLVSSFELTHGLDVIDATDTIPSELIDHLFKK